MDTDQLTSRTHTSRLFLPIAGVAAAAAIAGCGSSGTSLTTDRAPSAERTTVAPATTTTDTTPGTGRYNPKIDPAQFIHRITNPYFPLKPGSTRILKGRKDGVPQLHKTTVSHQTKMIIGVRCVVIDDVVTSNGALAEKTSDWYAEDAAGNVWYFGEASADYENGVVVSTKGSWEAGVDGAQPGIIMPANPKPGPAYYQEYRPGIAEDRGKVLRNDATVQVPAGKFQEVVVILDTNPLDPSLVQHKWYAPGVGLVKSLRVGSSHHEQSRLIKLPG